MEEMVTVFTPIYNRAYLIGRLYHSLLKQTDFHFEWLIVDDGSTDDVALIVHQWIEKTPEFEIRFYQQKNGGKHRAVNKGVQLAKGEAFFIVDSDDYITEDAVEVIRKWWKTISKDNEFAGVSGLRRVKNGKIVGGVPAFEAYIDATNLEREKHGLLGDKAEVYKTSALKKYPFPEFEGENFLTEAVVWDRIAYTGLKIRWFNKALIICDYRKDGLSSQGKEIFIKNPEGWGLYIYQKSIFYQLSDADKNKEYFEYYITLKDRISSEKIQKNLKLNKKRITEIKQLYNDCIRETVNRIGRRIALYGVGDRGKKLLNLYKDSEVEICYILDRKKIELPYLQIGLNDIYPPVDRIIVTPKDEQAEIMDFLSRRTENKLISYDEWKTVIGR